MLTGSIPSQLGDLSNLVELHLSSNSLTGSIPAEFNKLTKLKYGYLDFNKLSGTIPDLTVLPNKSLSVGINMFTFNGIENNLAKFIFYAWQGSILLSVRSAPSSEQQVSSTINVILSVDAGGIMSNNTYSWYKNGRIVATNIGNNEFTTIGEGLYSVSVNNSVATALTLTSNSYNLVSLPVTLTSFSGKSGLDGNVLIWKTSLEVNNKGFEIEKSADAKAFEKIGFVDGNGDSNVNKTYRFLDTKPAAKTYYRLKQLDWDGKFEYSRIIMVKQENAQLNVYPNPAKNEFYISGLEKEEDIIIRNLQGRIVQEQKVSPAEAINTENLSNGLYLIKVGEETKKVVIQN